MTIIASLCTKMAPRLGGPGPSAGKIGMQSYRRLAYLVSSLADSVCQLLLLKEMQFQLFVEWPAI